jgi:Ni/Fe-hydrogenase b-type cytochrome subunit
MADSAYAPGFAARRTDLAIISRHSAIVRVTHWITALSFVALLISGFGIILAHPRFYWGETGGVGAPSLFDLPLPFMLGGPSGWGRYMHFQSAWVCVLTGLLYVTAGFAARHFQKNLAPAKGTLRWQSLRRQLRWERPADGELSYNPLQRVVYLAVVFLLLPAMIWTGLAMSPAITSVFPWLVDILGGHQTARTLHFFGTIALVVFALVHVGMVWRAGFRKRVGAMITGHVTLKEEM